MKIHSLQVGKPAALLYKGKNVKSGIRKAEIQHPVFLARTGFEGDGQADLVHHGGEDKAVCVYPSEHYSFWTGKLSRPLPPGAFGENITAEGLLEHTVHIGDVFALGEAVVQVSQPRQPCFKLAALHEEPRMVSFVEKSGYTGFYLRVLQEGTVQPDSAFVRLLVQENKITVAQANQTMKNRFSSVEELNQLLALDALAESWKAPLRKRKNNCQASE